MKVVTFLKKDEITSSILNMVKEGTVINSDKSKIYKDLYKRYELNSSVVAKEDINKMLPWVHKSISNAKRLLLDELHRIDDYFLQSYLNEFCYKFNQRYFDDMFDRLLVAAVSYR